MASFWLRHLRGQGRSPKTITGYQDGITAFLRQAPRLAIPMEPALIRRRHISAYLGELADLGRSDATRRNYWATLSSFFGWLVEEGELTENPCARLQPHIAEQAIDYVTDEDMRKLQLLSMFDSLTAIERRDAFALDEKAKWGHLEAALGLPTGELMNPDQRTLEEREIAQIASVYRALGRNGQVALLATARGLLRLPASELAEPSPQVNQGPQPEPELSRAQG